MRTNKKKVERTINLVKKGCTYREIQDQLKEEFNSGLSNSTIRKIAYHIEEEESKDREIARLKKELNIFKNLYFELLEKVGEIIDSEPINEKDEESNGNKVSGFISDKQRGKVAPRK